MLRRWIILAAAFAIAPAAAQTPEPQPRPEQVPPRADLPVNVRLFEVPLGSQPHEVVPGPDALAWITDGGLHTIVRVDPHTDAVRVWRLPAEFPDSNLNTAAFNRDVRPR